MYALLFRILPANLAESRVVPLQDDARVVFLQDDRAGTAWQNRAIRWQQFIDPLLPFVLFWSGCVLLCFHTG
jgi:hypothetical protein